MKERGFIQYIVIIGIILAVVFLSQQAYFRGIGKNIYEKIDAQVGSYWSDANDWIKANIYPRVSSEVTKRGEAIKSEVNQEKEKISESLGEKIKNYFSGVVDSVFNPEKNDNSQNNGQQCPQPNP